MRAIYASKMWQEAYSSARICVAIRNNSYESMTSTNNARVRVDEENGGGPRGKGEIYHFRCMQEKGA